MREFLARFDTLALAIVLLMFFSVKQCYRDDKERQLLRECMQTQPPLECSRAIRTPAFRVGCDDD